MLSNPQTEAPAWFGKIAGLGDFASRRLAPETRAVFDTWLARGLAASRSELGERWMNTYLTSPIWCFALAPAVIDTKWHVGVMMPSVDSVGRYFPLLVIQSWGEGPRRAPDLSSLDEWFDSASSAALGTLQGDGGLERLERELAAVPALPIIEAVPGPEPASLPWRERFQVDTGQALADFLLRLADTQVDARYRGCSFWWPKREAAPARSLSIAVGLPPPEAFARLLEGDW
jgi:type VI secretion system protein ImpM